MQTSKTWRAVCLNGDLLLWQCRQAAKEGKASLPFWVYMQKTVHDADVVNIAF